MTSARARVATHEPTKARRASEVHTQRTRDASSREARTSAASTSQPAVLSTASQLLLRRRSSGAARRADGTRPCRLLRKPRARNSSGCNRCPQRAAARYAVLGAWSRVRRAPPATSFYLRASPAAVMRTAALRLAGRALRSRVGVPCELASLRSAEAACAPCADRVSRTRQRHAPHGSRGFSASGAPPPPGSGGDSEPTPEEVRRCPVACSAAR